MVAGPLLAALLGKASSALVEEKLDLPAGTLALPGVRLTLWLAALIIVGAGFAAMASLRAGQREERARRVRPPVPAQRPVSDPARPRATVSVVASSRSRAARPAASRPRPRCWPRRSVPCSPVSPAAPPSAPGCGRWCSIPATEGLDAAGRSADDGGRPGPARGRGGRAGAGRGPPRRHRPLRGLVDRLPGPRPGPAGRGGRAASLGGRPAGCGPTSSCCSTCPPTSPTPASARRATAWRPSPSAFHAAVLDGLPGPGRGRARAVGRASTAPAPIDEVAAAVRRIVAERLQLPG